MKKIFTLLIVLLCSAAFAQNTKSGTITGTSCLGIDTTNAGTVGISVQNSGTAWTGTIQPSASIGGDPASNISVTPAGSSTPQSTITSNGVYYAAISGSTYVQVCGNTVTNTAAIKMFPAQYSKNIGGGSGSGVGSGASPVMAFYLAPQCPVANTSQCYQTPANTQVQQTCTVSTSNQNVVCPTGTFTSADVGKTLFGSASCNPFQGNVVLAYTAPVTISSFSSSTTVGVSAVAAINNSTACIVWGNPDDTAAAALDTFFATASNTGWLCPKILLSAAGYMFTAPHFFTQPAGCAGLPGIAGGGAQGNTFLAGGFEVEGRGPGETIIWLPPDFPESGACTHGSASDSCFAVPLEGRFREFQISGTSNNAGSNMASGKVVINVDVGSLEYFTCTGIANFTSGNPHFGIEATHWARLIQVNVSSCGNTNLYINATANVFGLNVVLENAFAINANSSNLLGPTTGQIFTCYECRFFGSQQNVAMAAIVGNGGTIRLLNPTIQSGIGASASQFGYQGLVAGTTLIIQDGRFAPQGTNSTGIFCNVTCTVDLLRTPVVGAGTGAPLNLTTSTSSLVINRGGNSFTGGAASANSGTTLNLDSQGTAAVVAGNAVLSAGWGSTAAWTALSGGNSYNGTITNSGTGQAANPTIAFTYPTALPPGTKPSCIANQVGGTQAQGTFTASSITNTACTLTYSGTPIAASTEIVQVFVQ